METPRLKLVEETARARGRGPARPRVAGDLLVLVALAAGWPHLRGADRARQPVDASATARSAVEQALERGSQARGGARSALIEFRRELSREPAGHPHPGGLRRPAARPEPLRSRTRGPPPSTPDRGRRLSPVTVPVVRWRPLVLALSRAKRIGRLPPARAGDVRLRSASRGGLARRTWSRFLYASRRSRRPRRSAPGPWLEWCRQFALPDRTRDADVNGSGGPTSAGPITSASLQPDVRHRAVRRGEPRSPGPPCFRHRARSGRTRPRRPPLACRARPAALSHEPQAAPLRDLDRALELDGGSPVVRILAGEVHRALGAHDERPKRSGTGRCSPAPRPPGRLDRLLVRLARLEQEHGEPAAALRHGARCWRSTRTTPRPDAGSRN